jgi:hypothetical protein
VTWLTKRPAARESGPADDFIDSYVCWREACEHVRTAYDRWADCLPAQRALAFKSYLAALDREEQAAVVHSDRTRALRSWAA